MFVCSLFWLKYVIFSAIACGFYDAVCVANFLFATRIYIQYFIQRYNKFYIPCKFIVNFF